MRLLTLVFVITAIVTVANGQRSKSALLKGEEAEKLANQCSRPSPSDFSDQWEPTKAQILAMEAKFKDISKLKASCCLQGERISNPEDWYLQYAALVWKGRKIIYISAVSTTKPLIACYGKDGILTGGDCEYWKEQADMVCDGGTNWGVIYDVATGKFSNLAVNGVA